MTDSNYAPPQANLADPVSELDIPEEMQKSIKGAWIAGIISGTITLLATILALSGQDVMGFTGWELIDVALIFGLTYGIYRKSRACAVIMLIYFLVSKIVMMVESKAPTGLLMAFIFGYLYFKGTHAIFGYHKLVAAHRAAPIVGN